MLDEIGLNAFRDRELPTLSGGEQQRAHFARVLLQLAVGEAKHGPGVLLLDEPTSSLDLRYQINLVETGRRRAKNGTAVIAILHDLNLAARFADRVVVLHRGRLAASGTPRRDHHQRHAARCVRGGYECGPDRGTVAARAAASDAGGLGTSHRRRVLPEVAKDPVLELRVDRQEL